MAKDFDQLKARATKKLTMIGEPFKKRDSKTDFEVLVYEEDGKITAALKVWTNGERFDREIDGQVVTSNLDLMGGFDDINLSFSDDGQEMTCYTIYTGEATSAPTYGEVTIAELVRFIAAHSSDFPQGMKTKLTLGDFEGNTFHRKVSVSADDGRLHLSYELNELDDDEEGK